METRNNSFLYKRKDSPKKQNELEKIRCIRLKALEEKLEEKGRLGEEITLEEVTSLMLLRNPDHIIINETRIEEVIYITEIKEVMSGGFATTTHANSINGIELKKKFPKMWARANLESR